MIPVSMQPEPASFQEKVKRKGEAFLREVPNPTDKQWKGHEYWRETLRDLGDGYHHICAYCAQWISFPTGTPTVDHYIARKRRADLAYHWHNFRLSCLIINSRKGVSEDVLDPFTLEKDWFQLDFTSFMIVPAPNLSEANKERINATIRRLQLNQDEAFITSRQSWFEEYQNGGLNFSLLEKKAPFIAYELQRQQIVHS